MVNPSTCFRVKSRKLSTIAVYDSYRKGENGADYDIFLAKDEVANHPDCQTVKDMVAQILNPQRIISLPSERGFISNPQRINEGFFRPETPEWDIPAKLKFANNFVAMPGNKRPPRFKEWFNTGLRLFCIHWDYRTIVLLDGYDKMGHKGSFQTKERLNKVVQPLLKVFGAIWDAIEEYGDYAVNTTDVGFVKRKEITRCQTIELDNYPQ